MSTNTLCNPLLTCNTAVSGTFGMMIKSREFVGFDSYKYAFNGQEKDDEIKGAGDSYDFNFRIYDPRLGRFLSTDPLSKSYPYYTPYQFAGNNPIKYIDLEGLEQGEWDMTNNNKPLIVPVTYKNVEFLVVFKFDENGQTNSVTIKALQEKKNRRGDVVSSKQFSATVQISDKEIFESNSLKISGAVSDAVGDFKIKVMQPNQNPEEILKDDTGVPISAVSVLNQALIKSNDVELTVVGNDKIPDNQMFNKDGTAYPGTIKEFTLDRAKIAAKALFPNNEKIKTISAHDEEKNIFKTKYTKTEPSTLKVGVEFIFQKKAKSVPSIPSGGATCFIAGTLITMRDGTTKPIDQLFIGDTILSLNMETMKVEEDVILELVSPMHDEIVVLEFFDNTINANTYDHPYYVQGKGLCSYKPALTKLHYGLEAKQLVVGDKCYKYVNGKLNLIELQSLKETINNVQTYNINSLQKNHTYFANGILVDNETINVLKNSTSRK